MSDNLNQIELFSSFKSAMLEYFNKYSNEKNEKKKKSTISHRLALLLEKNILAATDVDIDIDGFEIVVKEKEKILLAILWSNSYLTEKEKEKAKKLHSLFSPRLTLAFSLLSDKDYILVYRFENDYLDYLHINKSDFSQNILKRCLVSDSNDDSEQLVLFPKRKRKK